MTAEQQSSSNKPLEGLANRDVSQNPINYAIDTSGDLEEFKPSKISRLMQFVTDAVRRHYNMDPTGNDYVLIVATSADKGQSFRVVADSTESQQFLNEDVWAKKMVEKEIMSMKLNESLLIQQAKERLEKEKASGAPVVSPPGSPPQS
jgi:hypothetical protein